MHLLLHHVILHNFVAICCAAMPLVMWCSLNRSGMIRARIVQELARIIASLHQNKLAKGLCFFGGLTCELLNCVAILLECVYGWASIKRNILVVYCHYKEIITGLDKYTLQIAYLLYGSYCKGEMSFFIM